ncbi:MAG: GDP-mannose 4,6-dehydratase [Acidimicrobiales bacterium]|jgi:GDP-4-dehydro-6-deoxy-D-mannose reductase|nr:GDP-mannose 4,6-dehydratase [Acidimicrobiales bacterium]MDP6299335.1 GDP-mannose 4,6-dehydratase [Acidimicrobiales bacterium]HJM29005.1 GDP-mannose 4,6-dehydratase [Acidimicrobiales bacterium]HJM98523.1 GDP-mannose 4,6-dehydratase [Acidimicrobiales bacterium]
MLVLVTGAKGFVGSHLAAHLTESGDEVICSDLSDGGPDLLDREGLNDLLTSVRPDAVYHLAGQADVKASWEDPLKTFRINAEGTLNVLEACKKADTSRVLCVSSAEVYGVVQEIELPIKESQALSPANPYATSKAAAELICSQYNSASMEVIRVRSFNHFGPGQATNFVASALAKRMLVALKKSEPEIAVGNLSSRRDFTDVRDVVRAYRALILDGEPGEVYNVCSGSDRMISEIADALLTHIDGDLSLVADPNLQRPSDIPVLRGDNSKLQKQTGWIPLIHFDQSIKDIVKETRKSLEQAD